MAEATTEETKKEKVKVETMKVGDLRIKKQFEKIIKLLQDNPNSKVSEILTQAAELASAKSRSGEYGSIFLKDNNGTIVAIQCSQFERWMPLVGDKGDDVKFGTKGAAVDFGTKAGTPSGFNDKCKVAQNEVAQKSREHAKTQNVVLEKLLSKEISPDQATKDLAEALDLRDTTSKTKAGYAKRADVIEFLEDQGVDVKMPVEA